MSTRGGPLAKDLAAIIQRVVDDWLGGPVHNGTIYSVELTELIVEALLRTHPVALYNAGYEAGRAAAARPADKGFQVCPLCGDPERVEDVVGGVCLTCADAIAFAQNARRGSITVPTEAAR